MKIFTGGCFDVMHRGHFELLEYCWILGVHACAKSADRWPEGRVIVGLNSDDSVRRLKGDDRPINNQKDRKYYLESLKFVSQVILFDEDTPRRLIEEINPDIIVKGSHSKPPVEETRGYTVRYFAHIEGYSTTNTINEIISNR